VSLSASLQVGASALTASQLAIQVTGHNLANAATAGFTRQTAYLTPSRNNNTGGLAVGTGVRVAEVRRQIDEALQSRLYSGISGEAAMGQRHQLLSQVESALGELGEHDLSSELSRFFNAWSERANLSQSSAVVVQQGQRLAEFLTRVRSDLGDQRQQIDRQLAIQVQRADGLLSRIAELNRAVSSAEGTGSQAATLRDQRGIALAELSQLMEVTTIEQPGGAVDVLVGSTPVVLGGRSRGLELRMEGRGNTVRAMVSMAEDGQQLAVRSGQIGATLGAREGMLTDTIARLDDLTSNLIFEINRIHSTSSNAPPAGGFRSLTGSLAMPAGDRNLALNDPANTTMAGLPVAMRPTSGGFSVVVRAADGTIQTVRIPVDLDARTASGAPGHADDTSLANLAQALDAVPGLSARVTPGGQLRIDAAPGMTYSFADDSSGVLAALGINSYFTGRDASDIAVRAELRNSPNLLSVGRMVSGPPAAFVENGGALEMAAAQDRALGTLDGRSLRDFWLDTVQRVGVETDTARAQGEAASIVRESLEAQRAAISGVSIDEESVNLLTFQRQYQGAARFISVVDELTQVLLRMV
jgi:flagellar hook-associated protein 1